MERTMNCGLQQNTSEGMQNSYAMLAVVFENGHRQWVVIQSSGNTRIMDLEKGTSVWRPPLSPASQKLYPFQLQVVLMAESKLGSQTRWGTDSRASSLPNHCQQNFRFLTVAHQFFLSIRKAFVPQTKDTMHDSTASALLTLA